MNDERVTKPGLMVELSRALGYKSADLFFEFLTAHWNDHDLRELYGYVDPPRKPTFYQLPRQNNGPERLKKLLRISASEQSVVVDEAKWFREIDLASRGQALAVPSTPISGFVEPYFPNTISLYVYVVDSRMFAEHKSSFSSGFFYITSQQNMIVDKASTFYAPDKNVNFDKDNRRGTWKSEYVGLSPSDLIVMFNFEFDAQNQPKVQHRSADVSNERNTINAVPSYRGLIAVKSEQGLVPVFSKRAYRGKFYDLIPSASYSGPNSGDIYVELYKQGLVGNFDRADEEGKLRQEFTEENQRKMWAGLGLEP